MAGMASGELAGVEARLNGMKMVGTVSGELAEMAGTESREMTGVDARLAGVPIRNWNRGGSRDT